MPESPELILDKLRDRQVHLPESKSSSTREPRKRETTEEQKPVLPRSLSPLLKKLLRLFWFLCGNGVYTDSFFSKIVLKVFPSKHFMIL
jgi:hypothetical protein